MAAKQKEAMIFMDGTVQTHMIGDCNKVGCVQTGLRAAYALANTVLKKDVFNWDDSDLRFLKEFQMGPPLKTVFVKSTDEVVRDIVLERFTWLLFRKCEGVSEKSAWS